MGWCTVTGSQATIGLCLSVKMLLAELYMLSSTPFLSCILLHPSMGSGSAAAVCNQLVIVNRQIAPRFLTSDRSGGLDKPNKQLDCLMVCLFCALSHACRFAASTHMPTLARH